jgi:membrane associated rhomboid family serine protease|tara:strand:- start:581 stop:1225 length:645 start_codon:yes stop_codon:yes gene_type:complete
MFFPYKDDNPRILFPFVTYTIIGINSLVFIYQYLILPPESLGHIISTYALTPAAPSVITVFTSMFMHGGLMHIIFNMWFLWIFGDNIESVLGHKRYVLFYLLCGVGAALAQIQINTGSQIPMVGASGAIAGVLGAYLIRFPRATVHVLVILIIFITFIRVPAMVVIGIWFFSNLTAGLGTLGIEETGGTAWFAHLGGFVSGVVLNQVFKQIRIE